MNADVGRPSGIRPYTLVGDLGIVRNKMTVHQPYLGPWYRGPAFIMLLALVAYYVTSSFGDTRGIGIPLMNLFVIIVVLMGLRAFTQKGRSLWIGLAMVTAFVAVSAISQATYGGYDHRWNSIGTLVFFAFVLGAMANVVFAGGRVTTDRIFAAASVYLLAGICFGLVFVVMAQTDPTAFTLSERDLEDIFGSLVHFSFTTLTTVGYGNISPISDAARSLADMEAVLGQLYLAVVVARLVALQITHGSSLDDEVDV